MEFGHLGPSAPLDEEQLVATGTPVQVAMPNTGSRSYLLLVLASISATMWADRAAFNVLAESIKRDLNLTDTQIGVLGGIAFAALYALLSLPVARVAERKSRLAITVAAVSIWSLMSMLCAAAANFTHLALARAGVGIGEAACLPCANSLISDTYPPERRATAISVFSLSIPIGTVLGLLGAAWVAEAYSWRGAFLAVGAPGLLLALLAALTLKEPVRGRFDAPVSEEPPSLAGVIRHLWSRHAFRHLLAGVTVATMVSAGIGAFLTPYMLRSSLGLDLSSAALVGVGLVGFGFVVGTLIGGIWSDRLATRDPKWTLWVPGFAFVIAAPVWAAAFLSESLILFCVLALIGQIAIAIFFAPTFGALANMVEPRMRATAVAVVGVVNSLLGLGLGPALIGGLSDYAANTLYGAVSTQCAAPAAVCAHDVFLGLRFALVTGSLFFLWAAAHYLWAGSRLREGLLTAVAKA